jgi:hypothetical protein
MLPEERKAIARLAHEAINQRDLALLDGHPGYWQTRQVFPLLFTAFPDMSSAIEQQTVEGTWEERPQAARSRSCISHSTRSKAARSWSILACRTGCARSSRSRSWPHRLQSRAKHHASAARCDTHVACTWEARNSVPGQHRRLVIYRRRFIGALGHSGGYEALAHRRYTHAKEPVACHQKKTRSPSAASMTR